MQKNKSYTIQLSRFKKNVCKFMVPSYSAVATAFTNTEQRVLNFQFLYDLFVSCKIKRILEWDGFCGLTICVYRLSIFVDLILFALTYLYFYCWCFVRFLCVYLFCRYGLQHALRRTDIIVVRGMFDMFAVGVMSLHVCKLRSERQVLLTELSRSWRTGQLPAQQLQQQPRWVW